jgi:predicted ATPase
VEHAPSTVGCWLETAPEVRFLVTSRVRMRIDAERSFELGPLELPRQPDDMRAAAAQLWVDRAEAVQRDYRPSGAHVTAITEIVQDLDGIPLAIELAATRASTIDTPQLRQFLARRLDVLSGGRRDAPRRHLSFRAALDTSWDLLETHERSALVQCTVFRGGFTAAAADGVVELAAHPSAPPVLDVLQTLRENSLLRAVHAPDAELRLDTYLGIREYAVERAASGELEAAAERHAGFFDRLARDLGDAAARTGETDLLMPLVRERDNLLAVADRVIAQPDIDGAALTRALRVHMAFQPVTLYTQEALLETRPRLERLLRLARATHGVDPRVEIDTLCAIAYGTQRSGDADAADALLDRAARLATPSGNADKLARISELRGMVRYLTGELLEADREYERAVTIARAAGNRVGEALALMRLGSTVKERGHPREAVNHLEAAVALLAPLNSRVPEAICLDRLAVAYIELGEHDRARAAAERAVATAKSIGDRHLEAMVSHSIAFIHHATGELDAAIALHEHTIQHCREIGERRYQMVCHGYVAWARLQQGRTADARASVRRCNAGLREVGDPRTQALFLSLEAAIEAHDGRVEDAEARFEQADRTFAAWADDIEGVEIHVLRGALDVARAVRAADRSALAAEGAHGPVPGAPPGSGGIGGAEPRQRRATEAEKHAQRAGRGSAARSVRPPHGPPAAIDVERARERVRAARAPTAPDRTSAASRSSGIRRAIQLVEVAIARAEARGIHTAQVPTYLELHHRGDWFALGEGARVECRGHHAPRRILLALAAHWLDAAAAPVTAARLIEAAWPGERIQPRAARNRLHVALTTLRKLGLRELLKASGDGYALAEHVVVRIAYDEDRGR